MIYNILDEMRLRIKLVKEKGHKPIGAFVNPVHRTEILNRYYPHTDWSAVEGGLTEDTVIYVLGLIVCFDVNVPMDNIMIAYDPSPPVIDGICVHGDSKSVMASKGFPLLECQVEDPDNDPEILAARKRKLGKAVKVYKVTKKGEEALDIVDMEQLEKIYSPNVFKPLYCEYCRRRVSRDHRCDKGVR